MIWLVETSFFLWMFLPFSVAGSIETKQRIGVIMNAVVRPVMKIARVRWRSGGRFGF